MFPSLIISTAYSVAKHNVQTIVPMGGCRMCRVEKPSCVARIEVKPGWLMTVGVRAIIAPAYSALI